MKKLVSLLLSAALLCGVPALASDAAGYAGRRFTGADPWDGELTAVILSAGDGHMTWSLTDVTAGAAFFQVFENAGLTDGTAAFHAAGSALYGGDVYFDYSGTVTLRDGAVIIAFADGEMEERSPYGGSTSHHVQALEEADRTVVLRDSGAAVPEAAGRFSDTWVDDGAAAEIWYEGGVFRCRGVLGDGSGESSVLEYTFCRYDESLDAIVCTGGVRTVDTWDEASGETVSEVAADGLTAVFSFCGDRLVWDDREGLCGGFSLQRLSDAEEEDWREAQAFAGNWACGDAEISVTENAGRFRVRVTRTDGTGQRTEWEYDCVYDGADGKLHATGGSVKRAAAGAGDAPEALAGGDAAFALDGDGLLHWEDAAEDAGNGLAFAPGD